MEYSNGSLRAGKTPILQAAASSDGFLSMISQTEVVPEYSRHCSSAYKTTLDTHIATRDRSGTMSFSRPLYDIKILRHSEENYLSPLVHFETRSMKSQSSSTIYCCDFSIFKSDIDNLQESTRLLLFNSAFKGNVARNEWGTCQFQVLMFTMRK